MSGTWFPDPLRHQDKAFYEGSSFEGGLAKVLHIEAKERGLEVHTHRNLESLLSSLERGALKADAEAIREALRPHLEKELANIAQLRHFEVGEYRTGSIEAFLTERHHVLAVTFQFPVYRRGAQGRAASGLTQAELAARVGTTQSAIARLESGTPKHSPSIVTLQRYARAMGYRVEIKLVKERGLTARSKGRA